jgi:membrane fusion protein (multidrug efflux system)
MARSPMTVREEKVVRLDPEGASPVPAPRPSRRWIRLALMVGVPLIAAVVLLILYMGGGRYQVTDDARIRAGRVMVSANVPGRVVQILVQDNQRVAAGQVLFRLDPEPFAAAVREAAATLDTARLGVQVTRSAYAPRAAELATARAELAYQLSELERIRGLTDRGVAPRRDFDLRANQVTTARGQVALAEAALREAATASGGMGGAIEAHPAVQQAQAALRKAELDLAYSEVKAPQAGIVTRSEQLQVGSTIVAAQPLYSLVTDRVWIDANFRENQLAHLREGQMGLAAIDALPGERIPVRVSSLSPGAASVFALLPPENASGNFVKITQRLPVRLEFEGPVDPRVYRAGLSTRVRIDTGYRRTWSDLLLPFRAWIW